MKPILLAQIATIFLSFATSANAGENTIKNCRSIKDNIERLNCYDAAIHPLPTNNNDRYQSMTVNDVYLDWNKLKGKQVSVRGSFQDLVSTGAMRDIEGGGLVFVDTSRAPRTDRAIVAGCNPCIVRIKGRVFPFNGVGPGIAAESISKE